ncbi:MAG: hypothetical protein ACREKI_05725, partial [Gemmatimonadota bacterium]
EGSIECQNCGTPHPRDALDRSLWCAACVAELRRRAGRWGRFVALGAAGALAIWVAAILPAGSRLQWLWVVPVLLAYVLVRRIAETVAVGAYRARGL